jgi:hypothetical protein
MPLAKLILTFDYEVFGNGSGRVDRCVIDPAERLMDVCERFDTRLTFFVDVCELWAFKRVEATAGFEDKTYTPGAWMESQLKDAVTRRHDVQLHLHPQWLAYKYLGRLRWRLRYDLYRTSDLPSEGRFNLRRVIGRGKETLEALLKPVDPGYCCKSFRAGGLCVQPEQAVLHALAKSGVRKDSSVVPKLSRSGDFGFDFTRVELPYPMPYRVRNSIVAPDNEGEVTEYPICSARFSTMAHFYFYFSRQLVSLTDRPRGCSGSPARIHPDSGTQVPIGKRLRGLLPRFRPLDLTGVVRAGEMIYILRKTLKAIQRHGGKEVPLVAIGHCKQFGNEPELVKFLRYVKEHPHIELESRQSRSIWR